MTSKPSKIHQQCQQLWLLAFHTPQTLRFSSSKETERAKFTLYDAVRTARRSGIGTPELLEAVANCEICLAPDKLSLTLQNKAENSFFGQMMEQLEEKGCGKGQAEERAASGEPFPDMTESLRKLKEELEGGKTAPGNPYYKREEL
jgi:hypothetical protein